MRLILLCLLLAGFGAKAQNALQHYKQSREIATLEREAYARLSPLSPTSAEGLSSASANFDVRYYRCEWEVDPAVRYITGKITVYYIITTATGDITFDLMAPLTADSVKQRNTVLNKQQTTDALQVFFPSTVSTGVLDSITIFYKGAPTTAGFGSFEVTQHAGTPVMWTLSEPYGAKDWWPCKNGIDDKADSIDVIITTPVAYRAASNGMLQNETLIAGGTKRTAWWKHRYPIASYLVAFAVTNYSVINQTLQMGSSTVPMVTYAYPENAVAFQNSLVHTQLAMQVFNKIAGDYPFAKEKYGHVQFSWGGGMEHQTCSFMGNTADYLIAHELAHQWFGDKVTCGSWEDIWLNEGFASLLTRIFFEAKYPTFAAEFRRDDLIGVVSQPGGSVKVDDTTSVNRIFDGRLSYGKAGLVLNMLRFKLTDSVFFRGVRNYLNDTKLAYGFARTPDLKKHLEAAYGKDLTEFFNDWYSGQGYPTYNVQWTPVGSSRVRIKINQSTSHPSVNFFELPVQVKLKNATQQKTILLDNTSNGQEFLENIGFTPDSIFVDPDTWLISKNNTVTKVADNNVAPNSVTVFPNPIKTQFSIWLRNFAANTADVTLYNAAGQLLLQQKVTLVNGGEFVDIQSTHLPAGIYTLRITSGSFKYTKKLLKQF
jgi:aminopeptidase N